MPELRFGLVSVCGRSSLRDRLSSAATVGRHLISSIKLGTTYLHHALNQTCIVALWPMHRFSASDVAVQWRGVRNFLGRMGSLAMWRATCHVSCEAAVRRCSVRGTGGAPNRRVVVCGRFQLLRRGVVFAMVLVERGGLPSFFERSLSLRLYPSA